eukprot:CAMPEP_0184533638 /NCGR_PEP_ID=MMETSP0198_2-20121128/14876_1 /TAXON_ID=1112570 /ORGANISM="Thraustochytrium sp., Strain LLF1b" /LENGTH=274 /DNA_ID=CAMNT_0026926453 /DNA_START=14 /DNA_END=838 /DNA_ORIENTATION=-
MYGTRWRRLLLAVGGLRALDGDRRMTLLRSCSLNNVAGRAARELLSLLSVRASLAALCSVLGRCGREGRALRVASWLGLVRTERGMTLENGAASAAKVLRKLGQRVLTVESTTGGLIGASLLACPGASRFFISSCVVYSGRGYRNFLPAPILESSGVLERESNYANRENYIASKVKFVNDVALKMRQENDWIVVESGTTGPEFYIPGVTQAFTAVAVYGPRDPATGVPVQLCEVFHSTPNTSREDNMWKFTQQSLALFTRALSEFEGNTSPSKL